MPVKPASTSIRDTAKPRGLAFATALSVCVLAAGCGDGEPPDNPARLVAKPIGGKAEVLLPGAADPVRLRERRVVPSGTVVDARDAQVRVRVDNSSDAGWFWAGVFRAIVEDDGTLNLRLTDPPELIDEVPDDAQTLLPRSSRARSLWGRASGQFRTSGRVGAATIRGTKWLTQDLAGGLATRFEVVRGRVEIDDYSTPGAVDAVLTPKRRPTITIRP